MFSFAVFELVVKLVVEQTPIATIESKVYYCYCYSEATISMYRIVQMCYVVFAKRYPTLEIAWFGVLNKEYLAVQPGSGAKC